MRRALFIGRWSPFHNGHKAMIDQAISEGRPLLIAVRDTDEPWTAEERRMMIKNTYPDAEVIVIPDIGSVNIGRGVGYEIIERTLPDDVQAVSGTEIRAMIDAGDPKWEELVPPATREIVYLTVPQLVWFTGLPCSGKTTLARALERRLNGIGQRVVVLDGDVVRQGVSRDLGFSEKDREEQAWRLGSIAGHIVRSGVWAIVAAVSPTNACRDLARTAAAPTKVKLFYVDCPPDECERRDVKGMWADARRGKIKNFTGVDAPFDPPHEALRLDTLGRDVPECAYAIWRDL